MCRGVVKVIRIEQPGRARRACDFMHSLGVGPILGIVFASVVLFSPIVHASPVTATWTAGNTGNWNDPVNNASNWTFVPGPPPSFGNPSGVDVDVVIDGETGSASDVTYNRSTGRVRDLTISAGDRLTMKTSTVGFGRNLQVERNISNNGEILLDSASSTGSSGVGYFMFNENAALSGSGTVTLNSAQAQLRIAGGKTLTIGANQTVQGKGVINPASTGANVGGIQLDGTILANSNERLQVRVGDSAVLVNDGLLRSTGAGGLELLRTIDNNTAIEAHGSEVTLNGATVQGGVLRGTSNGSDEGSFTTSNATLEGGVHFESGEMTTATGSLLQVADGITNDGTINISHTSTLAQISTLRVGDGVLIDGTGEITLNKANSTLITTESEGDSFTIGASQTIRGTGDLLNNRGGTLNLGLINADAAGKLQINPGDTDEFVNQGTLRASGAGGVELFGAWGRNEGLVEVQAGSSLSSLGGNFIQTSGETIVDGDLLASGAADVDIQGGTLSGTGTVTADVTTLQSSAILSPGNSPGILTIEGDLDLMAESIFDFELLGATPGTQHDLLLLGGGMVLDLGTLTVNTTIPFANTLAAGDRFEVIRLIDGGSFAGGSVLFDTIASNVTGLGFSQEIAANSTGIGPGSSLFLVITDVDVGFVPTPAPVLLLLSGLALILRLARSQVSECQADA